MDPRIFGGNHKGPDLESKFRELTICYAYICIYTHLSLSHTHKKGKYVCIHIYIYIYRYIHAYMYLHMHVYTYMDIYIYIYTHTYIQTSIFVYPDLPTSDYWYCDGILEQLSGSYSSNLLLSTRQACASQLLRQ